MVFLSIKRCHQSVAIVTCVLPLFDNTLYSELKSILKWSSTTFATYMVSNSVNREQEVRRNPHCCVLPVLYNHIHVANVADHLANLYIDRNMQILMAIIVMTIYI